MINVMLIERPAMTNAERQRQFRERNPGYYARIQAAKRASAKRSTAMLMRQLQEAAAAELAAAQAVREPLMLPAPAEPSAFMLALANHRAEQAELVPAVQSTAE